MILKKNYETTFIEEQLKTAEIREYVLQNVTVHFPML